MRTGEFTVLDTYVLNDGVTPAFLASDLAHDICHRWQHLHGEEDTQGHSAPLEHDADALQIATGIFFGLPPVEIQYLQRETHTGYNMGRY